MSTVVEQIELAEQCVKLSKLYYHPFRRKPRRHQVVETYFRFLLTNGQTRGPGNWYFRESFLLIGAFSWIGFVGPQDPGDLFEASLPGLRGSFFFPRFMVFRTLASLGFWCSGKFCWNWLIYRDGFFLVSSCLSLGGQKSDKDTVENTEKKTGVKNRKTTVMKMRQTQEKRELR